MRCSSGRPLPRRPAPRTAPRRTPFAGLAAMLFLGLAPGFTVAGDDKAAKTDYHQSFRGTPENMEGLTWVGMAAKKHVVFEPEGLRLTLPTGFAKPRPFTGLAVTFPIKGDFEVTMNFEILNETGTDINPGVATRLSLAVHLATPGNDIYGVTRAVADGTERFVAYHVWNEDPGNQLTDAKVYLPGAKSGRLRLVRTAAVLSYFVAEGANADFRLLQTSAVHEMDVKEFRIAGQTVDAKASLDARVTDLRVRTGVVPATPVVPEAPPVAPTESRWKLWLAAAIVGFLCVALLCVRLLRRAKSRAA
jgi:hypothetical protein